MSDGCPLGYLFFVLIGKSGSVGRVFFFFSNFTSLYVHAAGLLREIKFNCM